MAFSLPFKGRVGVGMVVPTATESRNEVKQRKPIPSQPSP